MRYFAVFSLVMTMMLAGILGYANTVSGDFVTTGLMFGDTALVAALGTITGSFSYDTTSASISGPAPTNYPGASFSFTSSTGNSGTVIGPITISINNNVEYSWNPGVVLDNVLVAGGTLWNATHTSDFSATQPLAGNSLSMMFLGFTDNTNMILSDESLPGASSLSSFVSGDLWLEYAQFVPYFPGAPFGYYTYKDAVYYVNLNASEVPEPTSLLLLGTGLGVIGLAAWRRRK